MEKLDLLSYGIVIQIFRMMTTIAAKGSKTNGSVWLIDTCEPDKKEHTEVKKMAHHCFSLNEESFTKYIDKGIEYFYSHDDEEKINKRRKGASDDTIKVIRKLGKQAISFCTNTFETHKERYEHYLADTGLSGLVTPKAITEALENADKAVFNAVNEVYKEFMGTYIHAESDVSAADVLSLIVKKYCIESPVFDRIYILFDEFGRYIEFTANNPRVAGDSSLQQIFEAVQNADGRIIFDAFIQNDLNSYIRRVENAGSNISGSVTKELKHQRFSDRKRC